MIEKRNNIIIILFLLITSLFVYFWEVNIALSEQTNISIQNTNASKYPLISMIVTLSGDEKTNQQILSAENFNLRENNKKISNVDVEPIFQEPEPLSIFLILDTSQSMEGIPLKDAKKAAKTFLKLMKPKDQIGIISFGSDTTIVSKLNSDKELKYEAINELNANGETALYDAILLGIDNFSKTTYKNKCLIVISDGKDTYSSNSLKNVLNITQKKDVRIYGVGLESPEYDPSSLQQICEISEGKILLAPNSGELETLFANLAKELHNQYKITYKSKKTSAKDLKVELEIKANGKRDLTSATISNPDPIRAFTTDIGKIADSKNPLRDSMGSTLILVFSIALGFFSIFLLSICILSSTAHKRKSAKSHIDFYDSVWKKTQDVKQTFNKDKNEIIKDKVLNVVDYVASSRGFTDLIKLKLEQAGLPLRPLEFIFFHFLFTFILGLIGYVFLKLLGTILMTCFGAVTPILILYILIIKRRSNFHNQIPDTLNLITGSLRTGYSLLQAINVALDETLPPMSEEFQRVLAESRLGLPLDESLKMMAERMQETNFSWIVIAINIQREVGGNLAEVLEILADTIRERDRVSRQIKVLTAEGRLSAIILVILPFFLATILTYLNPAYMSTLITTKSGLLLVSLSSVLMIIGSFWLKKIVTIEV